MSDDARRQILQRRARFLAAAVATVGLGAASCEKEPQTHPQVCLSQVAPQDDATPPPPEDTGASAGEPMPCLSVMVPPEPDAGPKPPQPCLKVMAP